MQGFSLENLNLRSYRSKGCDRTFGIDALFDGEEIGFTTLVVEPQEVYISSVEVDPGYREKSIGSLLVSKGVEFAKSRPKISAVYTYAQNEHMARAFCGLFRPDQLTYWVTDFVGEEPVPKPIDSSPEIVVDHLERARRLGFVDPQEGSEHAATGILSTGVGIRAHLL